VFETLLRLRRERAQRRRLADEALEVVDLRRVEESGGEIVLRLSAASAASR
jgi:hypothetical protein